MNSNQEPPLRPVWLYMFARTTKTALKTRRTWRKADVLVQKSSRPAVQNTRLLSCSEPRDPLIVPLLFLYCYKGPPGGGGCAMACSRTPLEDALRQNSALCRGTKRPPADKGRGSLHEFIGKMTHSLSILMTENMSLL